LNCGNVVELIPAAVDGELPTELRAQFDEHLKACSACCDEFELERMTKHFVRKVLPPARGSETLKTRVLQQLAQENSRNFSTASLLVSKRRSFSPAFMVTAGTMGAIIFLLFFITQSKSHHVHTQPQDGNIIHQTYNNFDSVLEKKVAPQVSSDDPVIVQSYFQSMVNFPVKVMKMKHCKLLGGRCSEYANERIAHLLYQNKNDVIYVYQIKLHNSFAPGGLQLPRDVMNELRRSGWYFENGKPDCSLAIWITDSTICCAVADITKEQLFASLTENN
jgi:anti-sigma factor RsiW